MNKYRTHNCNELRKDDLDKDISISGWINKKRDHGNLLFIDLRDNYGITQCIIDKENKNFLDLEKTQLETVIKVNGKVVNIPSFQVSANDEISVREKAKKQSRIQLAVEISGQNGVAEWVDVDNKALKGVFKNVPARDELSSDISEQLIVELYSK